MPANTYDHEATGNMSDGQLLHGPAMPDSSIEDAAIASGIPAASLDIYYSDDDPSKHRHEHALGNVDGA